LHEQDLAAAAENVADLEKGRKQQLLTMSMLWRATLLSGHGNVVEARKKLQELALGDELTFDDDDKLDIINAVIFSAKDKDKRKLLIMRTALYGKHRRITKVVESSALYVVDIQLSVAAPVLRKLF